MRIVTIGLASAALLAAFAGPAFSLDVDDFYESCFARSYDAAHLDKHPGQRVGSIRVEIIQWEDNPFLRVSYVLRDGERYSLGGDCYDPIEGGYLCHRCKNDSCESGEQTFKVLLKSADSILIVNDTTGITGVNGDAATDTLEPGGEHGAFALTRTAYSACGR